MKDGNPNVTPGIKTYNETSASEVKRRRTTTKAENEALTALYMQNPYPDAKERQEVGERIGMAPQ